MPMTKYIFVTGGVVSSVGKGITVASIGTLLKSRGLCVSVQKLDPYLNVDPGMMSPDQHGEVFITCDGAETDLDLGNYERFIDIELTADSSVTSGKIYSTVIGKERRGEFGGGTIQVIPHVTAEIKERLLRLAQRSQADVVLVEVGGTVGDIEGQPFLEAIRQMRSDIGRDNVLYIHVTLLPYIGSTKELKTKPTQHSVGELRRMGIQPDVIVCRADYPISEGIRDKISLFCSVERRAVIPLVTVSSIYEVPLVLESERLGDFIVQRLGLTAAPPDLTAWQKMVSCFRESDAPVNIAIVGKYVEMTDAYFSAREALCHAGLFHGRALNLTWLNTADLEDDGELASALKDVQGIIVPGSFSEGGLEDIIRVARYARENKIPYLGLCLGMQAMIIEFARSMSDSNKFAIAQQSGSLLPEQVVNTDKDTPMRLGNYPCRIVPGTRAAAAYGTERTTALERHRCRFGWNKACRDVFARAGLVCSGLSPDGELAEICELTDHPWMVSCQFHPEFLSRPNRPHPLFRNFVGAAKDVLREGAQPALPLAAKE